MTDDMIVLTTAANLRESRKIARHLITSRLAACVNISSPVQSLYRWRGKMVSDREYILLIKTARAAFKEVSSAIKVIHSYATPEIIGVPIIAGSQDYLEWLESNVTIRPQGANVEVKPGAAPKINSQG